jgi:hypothetical protein
MTTKSAANGDAVLKLTLPLAERKRIKSWLAKHGEDLTMAEAAIRLIGQGLDWSDSLENARESISRGDRSRQTSNGKSGPGMPTFEAGKR